MGAGGSTVIEDDDLNPTVEENRVEVREGHHEEGSFTLETPGFGETTFIVWATVGFLKNLIGQYGVLHPLHLQCGCSSMKMCEQRTWTVCCFLLGPKPVTLESIGYQP